jgi:2-desacetyl-2-hydroxyethyl bacteriochlorophyllide A dehydrogenase
MASSWEARYEGRSRSGVPVADDPVLIMKAAVLEELPARGLDVRDVDEPSVESGGVVVEVEACGICGTDLHIMSGGSYAPTLPFVLGHEPVGRVVAVGSGVSADYLGQRVTATLFVGCGECRSCLQGNERLCERGARVTGVLGLPGGFAERMILRESQLVAVPEELDTLSAAALVDAGATAHNAARLLLSHDDVADGPSLVVGAGPVGFVTAEILRHAGVDVTIVERNVLRALEAKRFGYHVVDSLTGLTSSFASVVDCAADPGMVGPELDLLRPQGLYLSVGYCVVPEFDLAVIARRELTLRGVRSGTRNDLRDVLRLAAEGAIRLPSLRVWPIEEINDALQALRDGVVPGKAIVVTGGA